MPYLCLNKTSLQFSSSISSTSSMALQERQQQQPEPIHNTPTCSLDFLYCEEDEEDTWSDIMGINHFHHQQLKDEEIETIDTSSSPSASSSLSFNSPFLLSSSSSSDDDDEDNDDCHYELADLISKEAKEMEQENHLMIGMTSRMLTARREAIDWMTMANAYHGFSAHTLVLAVNYFDRFALNTSPLSGCYQEKPNDDDNDDGDDQVEPWMIPLVSIACLSLASKMEETHVPLLLDFQVDSKYIFEAKTVKRMELMVLSTLQWRMNPVTPLSYFENLIRIPGLNKKKNKIKSHLQQEILSISESVIVSLLSEQVILYYPPSVIAAAAMLHAMGELQLWIPLLDCQIHLLDTLKLDKKKFEECCKFIARSSSNNNGNNIRGGGYKRKQKDNTWLLKEEPLCKRSRGITSLSSSTSI